MRKTGAKYLIITHFSNDRQYRPLPFAPFSVGWRPINFLLAPFRFPKPEALINENCTEGNGLFADKCLAVWELQKLEI
jgi:hypothetical protein